MATNLSFANSLYKRFLGVDATTSERQALSQAIEVKFQTLPGYTAFDATAEFVASNADAIASHIVEYYTYFSATPTIAALLSWASSQEPAKSEGEVDELIGILVYDVYAASLNDLPKTLSIISETESNIDENLDLDYTVAATGAQSVEYTILDGIGDGALFTIDPITGTLSFKQKPDFEGQQTYTLTVVATDTENLVDTFKEITIKVNDVNEAPEFIPPFTATVDENSTDVFYTVNANDPENDSLTFSINNPADKDNSLFAIDPNTGDLHFNEPRDYESEDNAGGDRVYRVDVTATDNINAPVTQEISVTVNDLPERIAPILTLSALNGGNALIVTEGGIAHYQVVLTSGEIAAGETVTFTLTANNNTAVNPADFSDIQVAPETLLNPYVFSQTFETAVTAGSALLTFDIATVDDTQPEDPEQFNTTLSSAGLSDPAGNAIAVTTSGTPLTTVIQDNDITNNNGGTEDNGIDEQPFANDDQFSTQQDQIVSGDVSSNDLPGGNLPILYTERSEPTNGQLLLNSDGTFTYTPNSGFFGSDSFSYRITDADGDFDSANVSITVDRTQPVFTLSGLASESSVSVTEGGTAQYQVTLSSGSIAAGETVTFTLTANDDSAVNPADFGDILVAPETLLNPYVFEQTFDTAVTASSALLSFDIATVDDTLPEELEQFNLTLSAASLTDALGSAVAVATGGTPLTTAIQDNDEDTQPVAVDDAVSTPQDQILNGDVASNDTPGDNTPVTYSPVSEPANGELLLNDDGTFTYTPNSGFFGSDNFDYRLTDIDGDSSTANVAITVDRTQPVFRLSGIEGESSVSVTEGGIAQYQVVLSSGEIAAGETVTFTLTANNDSAVNPADFGDILVAPETLLNPYVFEQTFETAVTAGSTLLSFDIATVDDTLPEQLEQFNITLTAAGLTDALGSAVAVATGGTPLTTGIQDNDVDTQPVTVDDNFNILISESGPASVDGDVSVNDILGSNTPLFYQEEIGPAHGTLIMNSDGKFNYETVEFLTQNDTFTYRATDVDGDFDIATVTIVPITSPPPQPPLIIL